MDSKWTGRGTERKDETGQVLGKHSQHVKVSFLLFCRFSYSLILVLKYESRNTMTSSLFLL